MSKPDQYYQCRLEREAPGGVAVTTGWIEARGARVGARVELLPSKEFWTVAEVFGVEVPADVLKERQRLNRRSLPSIEPIR